MVATTTLRKDDETTIKAIRCATIESFAVLVVATLYLSFDDECEGGG